MSNKNYTGNAQFSEINANNINVETISANGSLGSAGEVLTSAGAGSNVYWTFAGGGGPAGTNTQITFNENNIESGDANLVWIWTTQTLGVNGTALFGNSSVNASINSTVYSGTANNATNLGGHNSGYYANVTSPNFSANISIGANVSVNTSTLFLGNSTVNTFINSTVISLGGGLDANQATGTAGQALLSGGSGANTYWGTVATGTGGPYGTDTQIAFNKSATESGDANLTWNYTNQILSVGNTTSNVA